MTFKTTQKTSANKTKIYTGTHITVALVFLGFSAMLAASAGLARSRTTETLRSDTPRQERVVETGEQPETEGSIYALQKITKELREKILLARPGETQDVVIVLKDQANLSDVRGDYRAAMQKLERIAATREADRDEHSIKNTVNNLARERKVRDVKAHMLVNAYTFNATYDAIRLLDAHDDILMIDVQPRLVVDVDETPVLDDAYQDVVDVRAPEVWAEGYRGEGVRVGIIDSGVDYNHPALVGKIDTIQTGSNAGKPAFFSGSSVVEPFDKNYHGTHIAGIVLGDKAVGSPNGDPDKYIGIAPDSTYVAGTTVSSFSTYEWIINPDGDISTDDYPIVINNSYGVEFGYESYILWKENIESLGILMVYSAGNTGVSGLEGLKNYPGVFSVANAFSPKQILESSSSHGPATYLNEVYQKPDVAAPGSFIMSAVPENYNSALYLKKSGTSMATPQVTGVVALIQEAYAELTGAYLSVPKVQSILHLTAKNMYNDSGIDDLSGAGFVDAKAALDLTLEHGTLSGVVKNSAGAPVSFASIEFSYNGLKQVLYTDKFGYYEMAMPFGTYDITFGKKAHESAQANVSISAEANEVIKNITLVSPNAYFGHDADSYNLSFVAPVGGQQINTLNIYNHGAGQLTLTNAQISNEHFSVLSNFPIVVEPYSSAEVKLSYSPESAVQENGVITFSSNATNSAQIQVTGSGNSGLFADVTGTANIHHNENQPDLQSSFYWGSAVWSDISGDSMDDVIFYPNIYGNLKSIIVAENNLNHVFTQSTDQNNIFPVSKKPHLLRTVDIDNDGDQDAVMDIKYANTVEDNKLVIRLNDGTGNFGDNYVVDTGFDSHTRLNQFTIADFNNDGLLDIASLRFDTVLGAGMYMYQQVPGETISFEKMKWFAVSSLPSGVGTMKFQNVHSFDYNNDGLMDIFLAGEATPYLHDAPIILLKNSGQSFEYQSMHGDGLGVDVAFRDYNNDGFMDVYIQKRKNLPGEIGISKDIILKNVSKNSASIFNTIDSPYEPVTESHVGAGGVNWFDYDNDGDVDIFFVYDKAYNYLFRNNGSDNYEEVSAFEGVAGKVGEWGEEEVVNSMYNDYDGDGNLDIYVVNSVWYNKLFRNTGSSNHWVQFELEGVESNRDAIGARVVLKFKDGTILSDQVLVTHHSAGQEPRTIHFGLGTKTEKDIQSVDVYWPSGNFEELVVSEVDTKVLIKEGGQDPDVPETPVLYGDLDANGEVTIADALCAQQYASGVNTTCLAVSLDDADLDCDGKISSVEVYWIQVMLAEPSYPGDVNQDGIPDCKQ